MKRTILLVITVVLAFTLSGCFGSGGTELPGVKTENGVDPAKVEVSKYKNNLDDLEKYLTALKYLPDSMEPTEMMYNVIGAVKGDRYIFTVDNSSVTVELYEFDPQNLNSDAKRIIGEINKTGSFKVFSAEDEVEFPAELSDNNKYLLIYTDNSNNDSNKKRKEDFTSAVKNFYK